MSSSKPTTIDIPTSYHTLPVKDIAISHHPASSPTATPVIIITLNRPRKQNSFTSQMLADFELVYPKLDLDERVKCIVITGAGKTFCAGADITAGFPTTPAGENVLNMRDPGGRLALLLHHSRKPTIVALQGPAVGLGMTVPLAATIRIAHSPSQYGFVFARRGITMESASSYFLPRLIGYSTALYLLATGSTYRGDSKHFSQLFHETHDTPEKVVARAIELAEEIAKKTSGLAGYLNRMLMWRGEGSAEEQHLLDSAMLFHMFDGRDVKEGVGSFFEKREPVFKATVEGDAPGFLPWWKQVDVRDRRVEVRKEWEGKAKL